MLKHHENQICLKYIQVIYMKIVESFHLPIFFHIPFVLVNFLRLKVRYSISL